MKSIKNTIITAIGILSMLTSSVYPVYAEDMSAASPFEFAADDPNTISDDQSDELEELAVSEGMGSGDTDTLEEDIPETEKPLEYKTIEKVVSDRTVEATGTMPGGAELVVKPISAAEVQDVIANGDDELKFVVCEAYDIKIHIDGEEWQPKDNAIEISVKNADISKDSVDCSIGEIPVEPVVIHIDEANNVEQLNCSLSEEDGSTVVDFATGGFSTFVIGYRIYNTDSAYYKEIGDPVASSVKAYICHGQSFTENIEDHTNTVIGTEDFNTLLITGSGAIKDSYDFSPYESTIKYVVIDEGITKIPESIFDYDKVFLNHVSLAETISFASAHYTDDGRPVYELTADEDNCCTIYKTNPIPSIPDSTDGEVVENKYPDYRSNNISLTPGVDLVYSFTTSDPGTYNFNFRKTGLNGATTYCADPGFDVYIVNGDSGYSDVTDTGRSFDQEGDEDGWYLSTESQGYGTTYYVFFKNVTVEDTFDLGISYQYSPTCAGELNEGVNTVELPEGIDSEVLYSFTPNTDGIYKFTINKTGLNGVSLGPRIKDYRRFDGHVASEERMEESDDSESCYILFNLVGNLPLYLYMTSETGTDSTTVTVEYEGGGGFTPGHTLLYSYDGTDYYADEASYNESLSETLTERVYYYFPNHDETLDQDVYDVAIAYGYTEEISLSRPTKWLFVVGAGNTPEQVYPNVCIQPGYQESLEWLKIDNYIGSVDVSYLIAYIGSHLTRITVGEGVESIEAADDFNEDPYITTLELPSTLTKISGPVWKVLPNIVFEGYPIGGITEASANYELSGYETGLNELSVNIAYWLVIEDEDGNELYREKKAVKYPRYDWQTYEMRSEGLYTGKLDLAELTDWTDRDEYVIYKQEAEPCYVDINDAGTLDEWHVIVKHREEYTARFYNYDGALITESTANTGSGLDIPAYGTDFSGPEEVDKTTVFLGWKRERDRQIYSPEEIETDYYFENEVFTAQFGVKSDLKEYTITFWGLDDSIISRQTYHYGDIITIPTVPPVQSPYDENSICTFVSFSPSVETVCTRDMDYYVCSNSESKQYIVRLLNADGSLYKMIERPYGTTLEDILFFGTTPTEYTVINARAKGQYVVSPEYTGLEDVETGQVIWENPVITHDVEYKIVVDTYAHAEYHLIFKDKDGTEVARSPIWSINDNYVILPIGLVPMTNPETGYYLSGWQTSTGTTVFASFELNLVCAELTGDVELTADYLIDSPVVSSIAVIQCFSGEKTLIDNYAVDSPTSGTLNFPASYVEPELWDKGRTFRPSGTVEIQYDLFTVTYELGTLPLGPAVDDGTGNLVYQLDLSALDYSGLEIYPCDTDFRLEVVINYEQVAEDHYDVRYLNPDGSVYVEYLGVTYGASTPAPWPTYTSPRYDYVHIGWFPEEPSGIATGDMTYTARFAKLTKTLESEYWITTPATCNLDTSGAEMTGEVQIDVNIRSEQEDYTYCVNVTVPSSFELEGQATNNKCTVRTLQNKSRFSVDDMTRLKTVEDEYGDADDTFVWQGQSNITLSGETPTVSDIYSGKLEYTFTAGIMP